MSDAIDPVLLSQNEIDSLLNMLGNDEESEEKGGKTAYQPGVEVIRRYDFHQPDRLSKEHLRTLRMIHENFARRFALQLSTRLRISIDVKLAFIETGPYANYVQQFLDMVSAMHLISLKPLPGKILLQYDNRLTDMLLDRLLGGIGRPGNNSDRELTDLELELLASITTDVQDAIVDSWHGTIELVAKIEETHTNPYFVQIALPTDTCAWVSFEVTLNGNTASINFCIPASVLKPIASKLSPQAWISSGAQSADTEDRELIRKQLHRHLEGLKLELKAFLEGEELMLSDLMSLQVGDVIPLQRHVSQEVSLAIQDQEKMQGHLGVHRGKLAIQITKVTAATHDLI